MIRWWCGLVFLFLWTATLAAASEPVPPKGIITLSSRAAPVLQLADMNGKPFDLAAHKGQWVFVHFWASWCGPCKREMPAIQRMAEEMKDTPLVLAIINTAEDDDTVWNFLGIHAPDLTPLMDRDGLATEAWQPRGLPSTYLVDPEGVIRYQALGGRPWDEAAYLDFLKALANSTK
jgi:thiol-disulfide isomerase/thioredoxin